MNTLDRLANAERAHNPFIYVMAMIVAFNGLLFGFDTGVVSGALLYIRGSFHLSTLLQEAVVSSVLVGAMVGAFTGGNLADRFGRRRLTIVGSIVFFVASIGMALATNVYMLIAWRLIEGVAVGFASIVGTLYISEIAPSDIRGSLGFFQQLMITIGILLAYVTNYVFAPTFLGIVGWRWMLGFGAVPAAILGIGVYFMPESPRWLINNGQPEKAKEVLSRLRSHDELADEIEQIRTVSEAEQQGSLADLREAWVRPALIVGIALAFIQQITGVNSVIYYAPTVLQGLGFSNVASIAGTVGVGIVNTVLTVVAILLADRVGRRPLLLVGTGGMAVMLVILGGSFFVPGLAGVIGWITLVSMILYVAFFAIGLGPVYWLLIAEIYPLRIRGTAEGVASVFNWLANFLVALTFLSVVDTLGKGITFWILAAFTILGFIFIYEQVPETMGRSLEEIEAELQDRALVGGETTGELPTSRDDVDRP